MFGESPVSWRSNRTTRKWLVNGAAIPECDSQKHLGILRTVHSMTVRQTVERCTAGRSTFFTLNSVGFRFGYLTSLKLYTTSCIPMFLYCCELWSFTATELSMLERVHCKILRTIRSLPLCYHSRAFLHLVGTPCIALSMAAELSTGFFCTTS